MPQTCEKCQGIFYSDTEFSEHQNMELFKELGNNNARAYGFVGSELRVLVIVEIAKYLNISLEEAYEKEKALGHYINAHPFMSEE